MNNTVLTVTISPPPVNYNEILRYMGAGKSALPESTMNEFIKECEGNISYNVCYSKFPLLESDNSFDFSFMALRSSTLKKNLSGCSFAVVFSLTAGLYIDRLISKYSRISPSKALFFQAFGAERVESTSDTFNKIITDKYLKEGLYTRPRISPGYGDFPLFCQKDILNVLDSSRKIGLCLNDSLIMSPSKSVTGIIGISDVPSCNIKRGCSICEKKDCIYRDDLK